MNGKTKSERDQERKAKKRKEGKRKAKIHKNQVLAYRRQLDRARGARTGAITFAAYLAPPRES